MTGRLDAMNQSPDSNPKYELSSGEISTPTKSPRYMRKKRVPVNQARRYYSQLSAQGKISCKKINLPTEKCSHATTFLTDDDLKYEESRSSSHFLENENFKSHRTLKHSCSLPSLSNTSTNCMSHSKSCDNLMKGAFLETESNVTVETHCTTAPPGQSGEKCADSISLTGSTTESVHTCTNNSRRSSTSTLRERLDSQDSAISQVSIIDMKEVEEAAKAINANWKPHHSRSRSDALLEIHQHKEADGSEVFSLPNSLTKKLNVRRKSIFEGQQMIVQTECFFPRPLQGQSLTSFLSSNEFNISAELDRENAHFCISDALISAIEHMKCSRTMRRIEEDEDDESDEEIRKLTQRIRIRRREKQREKVLKSIVLLSDGKTDTTTSQSASPPLSSHSSDYEIDSLCSEDEVDDLELSAHDDSNLNSLKENGLSLSMASLYSEADLQKAQLLHKEPESKKFQESDSVNLTAESVALSLLRKFSEKHLPKASELQWLVSEQEAPQRLLPLPDSWPISPDVIEEEYNLTKTRLRGNLEWAPPRAQIIFSIHPYMKRKDIIAKQKFRCAGCGMKIEKNYISRFRYCEYFGKYFCQCCHSNSQASIPGRILWNWDFSKYHVSKFAWELLDQMFSDPLFNIEDVNVHLYQKARQLDLCRYYRMQLFYLKDFVRTCRKAESIQLLLEQQSHHIAHEPHMYSLSDLLQVKSGDLSKQLSKWVNHCLDHVKQCILCQAKGFICEICRKDSDIIFPFQFDKVILCQSCGSCFHKRCCKKVKCPRCARIQERKKRLAEYKSDEEL